MNEPARRIGDLVRQFMSDRGWLQPGPYEGLFRAWGEVTGPGLADHARLVDVRDGVLVVEVDHPGWLQVAHLRKAGILAAARAASSGAPVTDLRLSVGSPPGAPR